MSFAKIFFVINLIAILKLKMKSEPANLISNKLEQLCNLCDYSQRKVRKPDRNEMWKHLFGHLATDFKVFRFVCTTFGCVFRSSYKGSRHQKQFPQHNVEDRKEIVERLCSKFIINRSPEEYHAEAAKAFATGMAFGENLRIAIRGNCQYRSQSQSDIGSWNVETNDSVQRPIANRHAAFEGGRYNPENNKQEMKVDVDFMDDDQTSVDVSSIDDAARCTQLAKCEPSIKEEQTEEINENFDVKVENKPCKLCSFGTGKTVSKKCAKEHQFRHLAKDLKIFRVVCTTVGCTFGSASSTAGRKHCVLFPGHEAEDRTETVEHFCRKLIDNRSAAEYQQDVTTRRSATAAKSDTTEDVEQATTSACNVCGFMPTRSWKRLRRYPSYDIRRHHSGHLGRDFRIYRHICLTEGCAFGCTQVVEAKRHCRRFPNHKMKDREIVIENICRKFIDNRSIDDYQTEVKRAIVTGKAFGVALPPLIETSSWLNNLCPLYGFDAKIAEFEMNPGSPKQLIDVDDSNMLQLEVSEYETMEQ